MDSEPTEISIHEIYKTRSLAIDRLNVLINFVYKERYDDNCVIETCDDKERVFSKQITDGNSMWHIFVVKRVEFG